LHLQRVRLESPRPVLVSGAFSREIADKPYAARLLDERVVLYRLADKSIAAARDICYHRGVSMSLGHVEGDEIICKYHGLRYDREGRCVCIPAHPGAAISPKLRLDMYQAQERYGLVWVRLGTHLHGLDIAARNTSSYTLWSDDPIVSK
jgi:phenylpropionate dioxygenase-like ring-hydroxylating dioxygenase large terminal subunit